MRLVAGFSFYESTRRARAISNFTDEVRLIPAHGLDSGSWDPSGDRLVQSDTPTEKDISRTVLRVVDASGGPPREVSPPGFNAYSPTWSPDGRTIAFVGSDPAGTTGCWLLDPATGAARAVLADPAWTYARPLFSPDGRELAISRLGAGPQAAWQLWIGSADGSDLQLSASGGLAEAWAP